MVSSKAVLYFPDFIEEMLPMFHSEISVYFWNTILLKDSR